MAIKLKKIVSFARLLNLLDSIFPAAEATVLTAASAAESPDIGAAGQAPPVGTTTEDAHAAGGWKVLGRSVVMSLPGAQVRRGPGHSYLMVDEGG